MSDFAHDDHSTRVLISHRTMESRVMYGAFYMLFLARAALKRLLPQSSQTKRAAPRDTIFAEARTDASVMVASSFMGL